MAVQTTRLAQRRKAKASTKQNPAPKKGGSNKQAQQDHWKRLYDNVLKHPCFDAWLLEHEMTREQFVARKRHRFSELKAIQEWCNRYLLLQKLEALQAQGGMTAYLHSRGYKAGEILSLWSTEQLQKAWAELSNQARTDKWSADRLGIAQNAKLASGYKGKTRSQASKRTRRPRREANAPRNGDVHLRNQGKSLVPHSAVAGNLPNQQEGPVQRGRAVAHAGLTSKEMGERKKRSPTRRKRLK